MDNAIFLGYNNIFSVRLRELMSETNTKQHELAKVVSTTRQAIQQYCDGSSQPNITKLLAIAKYFNVTTDYLLGETSVKRNDDPELKSVCDYTGLSESSVMAIKYTYKAIDLDTKKEDETSRKMRLMGKHFVDMFLGTELLTLYGNSTVYITSLLNCLPIINTLIKKAQNNEYDEELHSLYDEFKKDMNFSLFNLQECCRNLFKEVLEEDIKKLKEAERTYESLLIKRGENNGNS